MKITFVKEHKVKQGDGKGPHYKVGETHDLERSYAEKYKRLGLANDYVAPKPPSGRGRSASPKSGDVEPLQIRRVMDILYVMKPWPKATRIFEDLLTGDDDALVVKDGKVTITVANGFATYALGEDAGGGYRECTLVDSKYEDAPPAKA